AQLFPDHSIINLGFYAFLISRSRISKEHDALFVRKGSNGFVQFEVKEVQLGIDSSLPMVCPVPDLIVDSLFCFQVQVDRSFIGTYFVNSRRGEARADTSK